MRDERKFEEALVRADSPKSRPLAESSTLLDEYNFIHRMQQQADEAAAAVRRDAFDVHRYDQELKLLRTILGGAVFMLLVALCFSIWLIVSGRDAIGNPILSAIVSAALSYLAGLGTPREVLWRGGPGSDAVDQRRRVSGR